MRRVAAVIPAAGRARRFGSGENKLWATLAGRTVLEWTLSAFNAHPAIASIVLVANPDELERVRRVSANFAKVTAIVPGGETRAESVQNGLNALPADTEIVLAHDAARPLITSDVIDRVIAAIVRGGAAVPGLPLSDTVKRVDGDGIARATIPRALTLDGRSLPVLTAVQTPQGATLPLLREAYARFDFAHSEPTDEASLIEAMGAPVAVVPGDPVNIKITRQEDIALAERLMGAALDPAPFSQDREKTSSLQGSPGRLTVTDNEAGESQELSSSNPGRGGGVEGEIRTGFGYDVHSFSAPEARRKLYLGGVEIPHDRGLEGHSDADVLLHAVCDALLGAASLGDIGILFPNTDNAYKNISSLRLLAVVAERLRETGWQIVNIDATVVAEAPKLMPHRAAMQQAMADCLGLTPARISVKATTSEKMGFVGRREGMACWAVATLRSR